MAGARPHRVLSPRRSHEETALLNYILAAISAYLLGSIPTGYLVARSHRQIDILQTGSRRTGATNILRTLGWKAAAVVFLGDFVKGIAAVAVARAISGGDPAADVVAGLMAMAGHTFSLFLGFRGGRGVTTGLGALFVISPIAGLVCAVVALSTMAVTRYVSLGSILGALSVPVTMAVLVSGGNCPPVHLLFALAGSLFIVVSHRDNISRLLSGTERKFGKKRPA